MKLLVVSNMYPSKTAPSYGVFVKNFCKQLEELGISYDLAVMRKENSKIKKLFAYASFYCKSFFRSLLGKYDVVYVHYASHSSPGVLLARKLRKFCIFTNCHGSDVIPNKPGQASMQKNTRAILSLSKKIVVPSEYFKRIVSQKYSIPGDKIFVCASGGVNTKLFRPLPPTQNTTHPFTIGFASRIIPGKGWDTLLKACALLQDRDFRILLVGNGPEQETMLKMIDQLGLSQSVELPGLLPQQQLPDIHNRADVFVFPTQLQESLGLVALEAMACGCPVIASDFAAPADYVIDGVNGYKFPVGNAQALADVLQKFRTLPAQQRTDLEQGAFTTAQAYSYESVTAGLSKILLE